MSSSCQAGVARGPAQQAAGQSEAGGAEAALAAARVDANQAQGERDPDMLELRSKG